MGDPELNVFVPFKMKYVYDIADQWGDEPWNAGAKKCSEAYDVSSRRMIFLNDSREKLQVLPFLLFLFVSSQTILMFY